MAPNATAFRHVEVPLTVEPRAPGIVGRTTPVPWYAGRVPGRGLFCVDDV
jgi:hypothetical protein